MMQLRFRKALFYLFALLAAVLLPYGYYCYNSWRTGNELAEVLAELDRTAAPWRLADLQARQKPIGDEETVASLVKKAGLPTPRKFTPVIQDFKIPPWQALAPEQYVKLREFLDLVDENVKEARQLIGLPAGRFHVKISADVVGTPIPHVDDVRGLSDALQHNAWWQIQQGDFDLAIQSCLAAMCATRPLREELFLVSHLSRLVILRQTATTVERMLAQGEPPAALLPALRKAILEEADFDGWTLGLEGERAGMNQLFEAIESNKVNLRFLRTLTGARHTWHNVVTDRFVAVNAHQSHIWLLRHHTESMTIRQLPPRERLAKARELEDRAGDAPELARSILAPVWRNCYPVFLRSEAKLRCAVAGIAAEQFRQEQKRWPKTLEELIPKYLAKLPLDPYTGDPLKLRAAPDGIVIYSPGPAGDLTGTARDDPTAPFVEEIVDHESRLWNPDRRRAK
jgi:hypothetical protein